MSRPDSVAYHRRFGGDLRVQPPIISRFDMSCAQAHWLGSKPMRKVMQLKTS